MAPQFASLDDYIRAFSKDRELAIVPIPLVAEHLERSAPAVTAMISSGRLNEIKIGKNRFVALKSLVDLEEAYENQVDVVMRYLAKQAKNGVSVVFYEPVMAQVGMKTSVPADRSKIGEILGAVSERSYEEHGVLLSVIVHRKALGATTPGPGFFALAEGMGYDWEDDIAFVTKETKKVIKAYRG
ncbi:hypothetical protein FJ950_10365 [Mesorhizobium sp. B2-3-14]|uniref:hypothetical protein n=1 Tax=Mesorhizobium sp. B2-3-14 TaxID=2589950 RepID=UPI00112E5297|nr:hypothetical protein [Mesorhizobium sp. B2-3-14]TPL86796.1 hypothetical protein FJ950_10365 [Mesorhizobium sp. B2-3-14]